MQSYSVEYNEFRSDFGNLMNSTLKLPLETSIFVADNTGNIKFSRGLKRYGMEFPCLLKCIADEDKAKCLTAMSKGMSGVYVCAFDKAEFVAVQVCKGGRTKCVIVNISEKFCSKASDYLRKMEAEKGFFESFVSNCAMFDAQCRIFEVFEEKIVAISELIKFSYCTHGKAEEMIPFDYRVMVDILCKCATTHSCECIVHDLIDPDQYNTMCKVSSSYPKALLYAIAFLAKNSRNRRIIIDYEVSEFNVQIHFSTLYREGSYNDLYMDVLLKILSSYENKPNFHIENNFIVLTANLRLITGLQTVVRERKEPVEVVVSRNIFADETALVFRLVSGL